MVEDSLAAAAEDGVTRAGPAPGGPPRRHRRVRLQAAAPPADGAAGRRRGLRPDAPRGGGRPAVAWPRSSRRRRRTPRRRRAPGTRRRAGRPTRARGTRRGAGGRHDPPVPPARRRPARPRRRGGGRDAADRGPSLVTDGTVAGIGAVERPTSSRRDAIEAALAAARVERLRAPARARSASDPGRRPLAWEVSLPAAARSPTSWSGWTPPTGRRRRSADLLWRATASAALFDPNPVVAQGSYAGLRDARDRDSDLLSGLRVAVTLARLEGGRGLPVGRAGGRRPRQARPAGLPRRPRLLRGQALQRPLRGADGLLPRGRGTREYVEDLGLSGRNAEPAGRVRANGIRDDNSYYSPLTGSMTRGPAGSTTARTRT